MLRTRLWISYLNVVDVIPVPSCAEELVAESENKNVLDHLLTQVMINTVELVFGPVRCERALKLSGTG
jgi:hypothetical protein